MFAREVGVVNKQVVNQPHFDAVPATISDKVQIELKAPEACPRYLLRVVKNVNVKAQSPIWLQEKITSLWYSFYRSYCGYYQLCFYLN